MLTIIKNYILLGKNCNFRLYWSVSFGRNEFSWLNSQLVQLYFQHVLSFHAQIGSRVSVSERVNEFEHEN